MEIGKAPALTGRPSTSIVVPRVAQPEQVPGEPDEVLRRELLLEADQVGAEQAAQDLRPQRHLHEQLDRRERNVQEEADPQVRAQRPQHRRHQLELVVLHPDRRALGARRRRRPRRTVALTARYASRQWRW